MQVARIEPFNLFVILVFLNVKNLNTKNPGCVSQKHSDALMVEEMILLCMV